MHGDSGACYAQGIRVYSVKGSWQLDDSIQSKIIALAFSMAAEIERDLISQRTKEALRFKKEQGLTLGRPKGPGKSKLDAFRPEIESLLANGSTQRFVAKRYHTTEANLHNWLKKHGLKTSTARTLCKIRGYSMSETERVPAALQGKYGEIVALTDQCCQQHLNEEYQDLCRRMLAKLCRKRPSPVATGKTNTWACGIVYAVGRVNFLFDKSQTPHLRADELCQHFGLSPKTGSAKSTAIIELLKSGQADPNWTLPSRMAVNPVAWLIQVNGLIVDARHMPRDIQEEAFRLGLIPYLP